MAYTHLYYLGLLSSYHNKVQKCCVGKLKLEDAKKVISSLIEP